MDRQIAIADPSSGSISTSFQEELRDLLEQRCRWLFLLGFVIGSVVLAFYIGIVPLHPPVTNIFTPWINPIYSLYALSLGLAVAVLFLRSWSLQSLLLIDHLAISFNILLTLFIAAVFDVYEIPTFGIALLLIVHATFIPVPVASQVGLAATSTLGYPVALGLAYGLIPEVRQAWTGRAVEHLLQETGPAALTTVMLEGTFQLAIVATVSVLITKTLYHLRRSLHRAEKYGEYVIEDQIGQGGMGKVLLARHMLLARPAALKILEMPFGDKDSSIARFEREVKLSATLTHPNTITIYSYGHTRENAFYYAMEYLPGLDLQVLVERFGALSPPRTVFILKQVCGALAEAHAAGIIHRDIKPSNVFLTCRGGLYDFVKVLDFGIAKQIASETTAELTKTGMIFGTPHYLAPESIDGTDRLDKRGDLYSLGLVAYWMLVGALPFKGTLLQIIMQHAKTAPRPPSELSELPIPAQLDDIVMRCLEKDPGERYQSVGELEEAIAAIEFEDPWTHLKAAEWWSLHAPDEIRGATTGMGRRGRVLL